DNGGTYFYQLLHAAGFLPAGAPPRAGMLNPRVRGQLSAGQLIDRYDLACRPVRDLLADYLNERRPGIDYVTMNGLAYQLGLLFWKDLETHPCDLTWLVRSASVFCSVRTLEVVFADVVAGCLVLVPGSSGAPGARCARFRRGCGSADCVADGAESPA